MAVISIQNLKYRYPNTTDLALDGINIEVERGEFIGIVGANGAGKSTLSQAILGLVPQFYNGAYGGSVIVDGTKAETTPVAEMCRKVGLVFQNPFNQLSGAKNTVYDEVAFGMENLGVAPEEMERRIQDVLTRLDMWEFRARNPFDLSGGQMQRVAIASVLVMQPQVLVLDEPTSQLDPEGTEEVFRVVDQLAQTGITVIMIEQKVEKMAKYCNRLLLLDHGRQIAYDTPERVLSREDLEAYGVKATAFTYLTKGLGLSNPDGTYPVTLESTQALLRASGRQWPAALTAGAVTTASAVATAGVATMASAVATTGAVATAGAAAAEGVALADLAADTAGKTDKVGADPTETNAAQPADADHAPAAPVTDTPLNVFTLQDMSFHYLSDVPIFRSLNLALDTRATAIIGQNGAGKTTLVKLLKGLLRPVSGQILFAGEDISGKTVAMLAGKVGYVFQNPDDQIFKYNVLDEVMFGPLNIGMDSKTAKERSQAALERVGLLDKAGENPYDLQLHERKMIAIASVLAMDTDVVILDEPTIAQDVRGRQIIGQVIRDLETQGRLVVAILHDMDFVAEYFRRVLVMAHGQVLADGTAAESFAQDEALERARLQRPYVGQLCRELGFAGDILTVEEFARRAASQG